MLGNQLRRQDDEMKALRLRVETHERQEREHQTRLKEHERRYADLESCMREAAVSPPSAIIPHCIGQL